MPTAVAGPADGEAVLAALPTTVPAYFAQAQHTLANHRKNIVALHRQHLACATVTEETARGLRLVGEKAFNDAFIACLNRVLAIKKGVANADRCIKFVSAYSTYAQEQFRAAADQQRQNEPNRMDQDEEDEEDTPATRFVTILLRHLLRGFGAKNKNVRLRCCQAVALLISGLQSIDDDLFEALKKALLSRLRDKESSVRVQAIIALAKLQSGEEDEAEDEKRAGSPQPTITSLLLHALRHDPSAEVRRAALFNLTPSSATLPHILERLQDVDALNRRCVYLGSLSNAVLQQADCQVQLSADDWARVVKTGLGEREQSVMRAVKKLIASWVDADNGKGAAERFLDRFDVGANAEAALMAMKSAFEMRSALLDTIVVDEAFWQDLTPQRALLARAFSEHCASLGASGEKRIEDTLPLVTALAFRVQASWGSLLEALERMAESNEAEGDSATYDEVRQGMSTVDSLLHVSMHLDYGDEIGRRKMFGLVRDMVSTASLPESLIGTCLDVLRKLSAGQKDFVRIIVEIVQEIEDVIEPDAEASNSDDDAEEAEIEEMMGVKSATKEAKHTDEEFEMQAEIDNRRLLIVAGLLERVAGGMQENTAMHGLVSQLIAPAVKSQDAVVRERGLRCLGLCCLLDAKLAVTTFLLFLQQVEQAEGTVRLSSLEVVFDLLGTHGITYLCQPQIQQAGGDAEAAQSIQDQIIGFLQNLLEDEAMAVQAVAAEGLSKLMLTGIIEEDEPLRSLVLVYMSPETNENQALRQCLSYFLPMYCYSSAAHQRRLQRVFVPVLDVLTEVYFELDEAQDMISPLQVGTQLLDWCEPSKAMYEASDEVVTIHIDLAIEMVQSLYLKEAKEDRKVLCQLLGKLTLPEEDKLGTAEDNSIAVLALFVLIGTMQRVRPLEDATSARNLVKFQGNCKKLYPTLWKRLQDMDLIEAPELDGVRTFITQCGYDAAKFIDIGDDGSIVEGSAPRRPTMSRSISAASKRTTSSTTVASSRIASNASSVAPASRKSNVLSSRTTPTRHSSASTPRPRRQVKESMSDDEDDMAMPGTSLAQRMAEQGSYDDAALGNTSLQDATMLAMDEEDYDTV